MKNQFDLSLKKYLAIFAGQEMYFVNDQRNIELFAKSPKNSNSDEIRVKISAINDPDLTRLAIQEDMINHILKLNIDEKLQRGDQSIVEDIASLTVLGSRHHLLHFASVYCNFHRPDAYPIYSEQYFDFYRRYIAENKLALNSDQLTTYAVFSSALQDLITRLGLKGKMNYLQLRKFAWLYAGNIMKESAV